MRRLVEVSVLFRTSDGKDEADFDQISDALARRVKALAVEVTNIVGEQFDCDIDTTVSFEGLKSS